MEDDPYLDMVITQGNTAMIIEAYLLKASCNANFDFDFNFRFTDLNEDEEHAEGGDYAETYDNYLYPLKPDDEDGFLLSRELLSDMISRLSCRDNAKNMTILSTWKETIYFLLDYALRGSGSPGTRQGASFLVNFCRLPSSMTSLRAVVHSLTGPGNLLRRHELGKDDRSHGGCRCAICLEEFERGDDLTCMPCSHAFHYRCLAEWLPRRCTCPLCMYKMDWRGYG